MTEPKLTLWAESPEEARIFLERASRHGFARRIDTIYVAKRSPKNRTNAYVEGEYFCTSNTEEVLVYNEIIIAPPSITALVQWCTCDIMLSVADVPLAVLEDTTHIVRMNVFQRIPRIFKAVLLGVPAVVLQGTRGLDFALRGDCWGMHRNLSAIAAINRLFPLHPALVFHYVPTVDGSEHAAEQDTFLYLSALASGDDAVFATIRAAKTAEIESIAKLGYLGQSAPQIPSIEVTDDSVIVHVGARPEKKSWKEKGSGQMDPYIGMIAAAKYLYCFKPDGTKSKKMVVSFTHLPKEFWWFANWKESRSLYKTLAFEIADEVWFDG